MKFKGKFYQKLVSFIIDGSSDKIKKIMSVFYLENFQFLIDKIIFFPTESIRNKVIKIYRKEKIYLIYFNFDNK